MVRAPLLLLGLCACVQAPRPNVSPPSLGRDGPATYAAYLSQRPTHYKLRHEVNSRFGEHQETIDGFLVVEAPERFFVEARHPFGPALFSVKSEPPKPLDVQVYMAELKDQRLAQSLAADIRRVYLTDCPKDAHVEAQGDRFVVSCSLGADERLTLVLAPSATIAQKIFWKNGSQVASIDYLEYRPFGTTWLATRIVAHASAGYDFTVSLIDADLNFDTHRVFLP